MKYLPLILIFGFAGAQSHLEAAADLKSFHRILIVGDSITHHAPAPQIGWAGDWGMAASAADKDYAHLFLAKLNAARGAGTPAPEVWIFAEGGGKISDKLPFADKITAFHADLALIQLGENDNTDVTVPGFREPYEKLLAAIRAGNPAARILCAGVWGLYPTGDITKNVMVRAACQKYGATFADLGGAFADQTNRAAAEHRFTNTAVNWHPGDRGMVAYADAFWQAFSSPPAAPAGPAQADTSEGEKPFEANETWGGQESLDWTSTPPVVRENGRDIAKISANGTDGTMFGTPLSLARVAGREVRIRTRVRGESVSDKPNAWNGVKLMLTIHNAEGALDYPQFELPTGTFDWMNVDWTVRVPDNAVEVDLNIGLEKVTGTVCFDAIQISTQK